MYKQWYINDIKFQSEIKNINPVIQKILTKRGLTDQEEINKFLTGDLKNLYDPFLFRDMEKAVKRIKTALEREEKVIIYGDYDVDGITSATLLYYYFRDQLELKVDYYLPNRLEEGYGLNLKAIKYLVTQGYGLMVTVDCGITARKEISKAQHEGLDVIVTDHHQPGDQLPPALAVIDPSCKKDGYPFSDLAGVGVAFKLCQALSQKIERVENDKVFEHLDIVALGSVADIVPLQDENRILVKEGIKILSETKKLGLKTLLAKLKLTDTTLNPGKIGYILAPPLNAAGRMEDPVMGIRLLTTSSSQEAETLAKRLVNINKKRQEEEERILNEALRKVKEEINLETAGCIVLASSDWHPGVIGIVASRLVEKFYLPVILIAIEDGMGKGSCRSIRSLNIFDALKACEDNLENYGGHAQAAGLSIKKGKIKWLRQNLESYINKYLTAEDLIPELKLDAVINQNDIDRKLYEDLKTLRPFGYGNPSPRLLINNVQFDNYYWVGKNNQHLKFTLGTGLTGIGFNFEELKDKLEGTKVDLAFNLDLNKWNGEETLQLKLKDINLRSEKSYYPVNFVSGNWKFFDKRESDHKKKYLEHYLKQGRKGAVYLNNLSSYQDFFSGLKTDNLFDYKQGGLEKFQRVETGLFFFSNTEFEVKIEIEDLIFVSLPFSLQNMGEIINLFDFSPCRLHLLFGEDDYFTNQKLIKERLPTSKFLHSFYSELKNISRANKVLVGDARQKLGVKNDLFERALQIFLELNIIEYNKSEISFCSNVERKLDLSKSVRYNKNTDIIDDFNKFANLAFNNNIFKLVHELNIQGGRQ